MSTLDRLAAALADRYRVERPLGEGGMATVYLAEDLKHKRQVAIKVLKPELAAVLGAERFVQEITTTAALQHPHILPLFDSGEADGFLYYVMPFIDGETLRDRLNRETQLPVEDAVRITRELADALDSAHRQGVVHRDIKPENILLQDGRPLLADFGIALAVSAAAGGRMTETGLSLGTPHYMSPEQATAEKEISARSDIYSLASVCYEMLAGQPPHLGGSAQQIIMKIIAESPPPVTTLRRAVPANVAAALQQGLEKLPADRFTSAKAFAAALADEHFTGAGIVAAGAASATLSQRSRALVAACAAVALASAALATWAWTRADAVAPPSVYELALPKNASPLPGGFIVLSRDGRRMIYLGTTERGRAEQKLWMKLRDSLRPVPLPQTNFAWAAALSPDGEQLAYVVGDFLRRLPMSARTGSLVATGVANVPGSVAWVSNDELLFVGPNASIMRVTLDGEEPTTVWRSDSLQIFGLSALPDRKGVLFLGCTAPCDRSDAYALRLGDTAATRLADQVSAAIYLPGDHLLTVSNPERVATVRPFDPDAFTVSGTPRAIIDSVATTNVVAYIAAADDGTIVSLRGSNYQFAEYALTYVDRNGRETLPDPDFTFRITRFAGDHGWALSPDGSRVALGRNAANEDDIWVKALPRGAAARITFDGRAERRPRWTPDGRRITYVTDDGVFVRNADGTGEETKLLAGRVNEAVITPNGEWLVIRRGALGAVSGGRDIFARRLTGSDTALRSIIATDFDENSISISPDSRWLAYESDETGRQEVFVRPFPDASSAKVQVSTSGGTTPQWSRDGRELFFVRTGDYAMMSARFESADPLRLSAPDSLFLLPPAMPELLGSWYTPWDVTNDGRFVMLRNPMAEDGQEQPSLLVFERWWDAEKGDIRR